MARKPRIQFTGAFYHIIVRGNRRLEIFLDDQDRYEYLKRLKHYKERCGFILYAYVLMTNHIHLLIETPEDPISRIMQLINFTYTKYFNRKYDKVGHLFQGRYKSYLCDRDNYLLSLIRYIHLNPVRAGLASHPDGFLWSSHKAYAERDDDLIEAGRALRLFSEKLLQARNNYKKFINEGLGRGRDEAVYQAVSQQIVGDDIFVEKIEKRLRKTAGHFRKVPLQHILRAVTTETGVDSSDIISRKRSAVLRLARSLFVMISKERGYKGTDLQVVLQRDLSIISRLSEAVMTTEAQEILARIRKTLNAQKQA